MRRSRLVLWVGCLSAVLLAGCGSGNQEPAAGAPASGGQEQPAAGAAAAGEGERMVAVPTAQANRPFVRANLDKLVWRATAWACRPPSSRAIPQSRGTTSRSTDFPLAS